jgi:transposase InsO family protein
VDYQAIAAAQQYCPDTTTAANTSTILHKVKFGNVELLCDTSGPQPRPYIPAAHRHQLFTAFHSLAHPGMKATGQLMGSRVVWPFMKRDIAKWEGDCQDCVHTKVTRQLAAAVQPIPVPTQRFSHIHVDFVGPLTTSKEGFRYLFTIINRSSRWLEAIPLASMDIDICMEALISNWVARFERPEVITSDRGSQFTSSIWATTCQQLGVKHVTTTAYQPQSNGMVERVHRHLKEGLRARGAAADWPQHLPWVLLNIRTTPQVRQQRLRGRNGVWGGPHPTCAACGDGGDPSGGSRPAAGRETIPTWPPVEPPPTDIPGHLAVAEMVYVRKGGQPGPLAPPYSGLYRVVARSPKYFDLDIGQEQAVTADGLKPHTGTAAATPAMAAPTVPFPPAPAARATSPGLPATTNARPARERRPQIKLDL